MATLKQLEYAWLAHKLHAQRFVDVHLEHSVEQPSACLPRLRAKAFQDAKLALVQLAGSLGYTQDWLELLPVGDEAGLLLLAGAQRAGVAAWLMSSLRAIHTRVATATNPATPAWDARIAAHAACAASDAVGTAFCLCMAALSPPRSVRDWGGTAAPHAAALLAPALLTAVAQAARGMAALARHTALPSTQALVGAAGSSHPVAPSCALACAALARTASQCVHTVMALLKNFIVDCNDPWQSSTSPLPEPVTQLAEALRESGLAAAAAWALMTCPGPNTLRLEGQAARAAVAVPKGLDFHQLKLPGWHLMAALAHFMPLGLVLQRARDSRPGAAQASAALGEALGHPEVAALRLAALEGLWEHAGMGRGGEVRREARRSALRRAIRAGSTPVLGLAHSRTLSGALGLWHSAQCGQLFVAGGGCLPPEPGVPPELQLARLTALGAEAVCRLNDEGLCEDYVRMVEPGFSMFHCIDWGLPPAAWASDAAPHWAEAAAWALATAFEAPVTDPPGARDAEGSADPETDPDYHPAEALAGALRRVQRVASGLYAAWQGGGAASSGRDSVLPRLRRAGLGASLDHALRLAYAAADRAAAPGASAWDVQLARLLEPVPARALGVVRLLGLELLGPVGESGGACLGPCEGLGLGDAGGLAVTVAKRALALAGQLEERAEAAPAEAEAAARTEAVGAQQVAAGAVAGVAAQVAGAAVPGAEAAAEVLLGSVGAGPCLSSQAGPSSHSTTAICPCLFVLRQQRTRLYLPDARQGATAAPPARPVPGGGAVTPLASPGLGDGAASPDAPAPGTGSVPASASSTLTRAAGGTSTGGDAASTRAAASGAPLPSPGPHAWGALASELEAYVMQAGSRLAACAAAETAACAVGPGPEDARLVGNCLESVALLCRTSEPGCPLVEARLLALQPHRLAAAACKLLCAWRVPPASPATAEAASEAAGGSGGGEAPGRTAPTKGVLPTAVVHWLPLALARMAAHSPQLASRVQSWLLPSPPDDCADVGKGDAEEAGAAGEAEDRGCLAQAWPAAMRSQAAAGAKDASALGLALLRAAQGGGGVGGGESGQGCSGAASDGSRTATDRFRRAAASLLGWWYAKGQDRARLLTASVKVLLTAKPEEDVEPMAAEAAAAVVAAPLPPLLAPPAAGRALTQLLVCGGPGCGSFGGRSEAELPLKRCGGCKAVRYCGAACQQAHWGGGHKGECGAMAAAAALMRAAEEGEAAKRHH